MTHQELDLTADIIDVRDIIERLEEIMGAGCDEDGNTPHDDELATLTAIMEDLAGAGGDEQWRGDWYPATLIRESHFTQYAEDLAVDCGDYPKEVRWPYTCIDWELAARELLHDYTSTDIDGATYYFR